MEGETFARGLVQGALPPVGKYRQGINEIFPLKAGASHIENRNLLSRKRLQFGIPAQGRK